MNVMLTILLWVVALEHVGFLVVEMFLWNLPAVKERFKNDGGEARIPTVLAQNIGLYNGFLAAGIIWGLMSTPEGIGKPVLEFFLAFIVLAGIVGGITNRQWPVFVLQSIPAAIALLLLSRT